ncbi:DUF5655 domain-containing protein [Acidaminobacter hydrogenoformans]|uniref:DUF5655 domain-containing protein n=1 Tax=Acidaminobacter hydrogenoformans DSM 2784 TaxID=1120920 RepID=A0A1G5S3L5_9FIRM|nr:DUF5655 domain-containing protein [Acidaminobacter hydrogenoformans]SCZ80149.1 hypothetical protein SAMN03080599_02126 [Acidaminobacter hydrogenoformans DSM 2784]
MQDKVQSDVTAQIADFFASAPDLLSLYCTLEPQLFALGDVTRKLQKTQISFSAHRAFAWVWLPIHKVKGRPERYFILSFCLNRQLSSPRITESLEPYPGRWMHHLILTAPEEIDEVLLEWLREAYNFGLR